MRQLLGAWGERAAARFLRRRGYVIVERNYRCPVGEIDLVAVDGDTLVFVEVKTRTGDAFGTPFEAVDGRKRRRLLRAATHFLRRRGGEGSGLRFDVVGVTRTGLTWRCELVQDAFDASG